VRFIWDYKGNSVLKEATVTNILELIANPPKHVDFYWFHDKENNISGVATFSRIEEKTVSISIILREKGLLKKVVDIARTTYAGFKYVRERKGKFRIETLETFGRLVEAIKI